MRFRVPVTFGTPEAESVSMLDCAVRVLDGSLHSLVQTDRLPYVRYYEVLERIVSLGSRSCNQALYEMAWTYLVVSGRWFLFFRARDSRDDMYQPTDAEVQP